MSSKLEVAKVKNSDGSSVEHEECVRRAEIVLREWRARGKPRGLSVSFDETGVAMIADPRGTTTERTHWLLRDYRDNVAQRTRLAGTPRARTRPMSVNEALQILAGLAV